MQFLMHMYNCVTFSFSLLAVESGWPRALKTLRLRKEQHNMDNQITVHGITDLSLVRTKTSKVNIYLYRS